MDASLIPADLWDRGLSIGIVILLTVAGLWGARALWTFCKPHLDETWKQGNEQKKAVTMVFKTLSEVEPQRLEILKKVEVRLDNLDDHLEQHARECAEGAGAALETKDAVKEILEHIKYATNRTHGG
jgi:hypothetical protein